MSRIIESTMRLIEFEGAGPTEDRVFINPDHVCSVTPFFGDGASLIRFADKSSLCVRGDALEVAKKLAFVVTLDMALSAPTTP